MKTLITRIALAASISCLLSACGGGGGDTRDPIIIAPPQATIEATINRYLDDNLRDSQPGLSVLVRKDGEVVYAGGRGLANRHSGETIRAETGFRIGSISKPFTALAIMQLVERGMLRLDDRLDVHINEIPANYAGITVEQLLAHRSGIPDYINDNNELHLLDGLTTAQFIQLAIDNEVDNLEFSPGTTAQYSNSGYVLLAEIVSRVSGLSFPEYMDLEIFQPLGMTDSFVIHEHQHLGDNGAPFALSLADTRKVYATDRVDITFDALIYGSSNVVSSAEDMARFLEGLEQERIVSYETLSEMLVVRSALTDIGDYGLGWITGTGNYWHKGRYTDSDDYWHSGGYGGYRSLMSISPDDGLDIVVLSNGGDDTQPHTWNILELTRNYYAR